MHLVLTGTEVLSCIFCYHCSNFCKMPFLTSTFSHRYLLPTSILTIMFQANMVYQVSLGLLPSLVLEDSLWGKWHWYFTSWM